MAGYITYPITTDPDEIAAIALDFLTANLPGWIPQEGHLEVWMIEAIARMVAEARDVASRVPTSIFRYYGQSLIDLPPIDGAPAQVETLWTAVDGLGYTIRAGTIAGFRVMGDELIPFVVVADTAIPVGFNTANVHMQAVNNGEAANAIPVGAMEIVDSLSWVASIASTTITAGGADAETDQQYLDRLTEELSLMSPRLILPNDFAIYARRTPGVYRAVAIDGYDPGLGTYNHDRTISVAVVDVDGNAVPAGVKTAVDASLQEQREVNFLVYVIDPTITAINVTFTAKAQIGFLPADVETRAEAAVTAYLQSSSWGGGNLTPPQWVYDDRVRYLEVATILNNVEGLQYVTALTIQGVAADYVLPGVAPLTSPGAIVGTVT